MEFARVVDRSQPRRKALVLQEVQQTGTHEEKTLNQVAQRILNTGVWAMTFGMAGLMIGLLREHQGVPVNRRLQAWFAELLITGGVLFVRGSMADIFSGRDVRRL